MTSQEIEIIVVNCIAEWISICEETNRVPNVVDAQHSALLSYLLSGNRPFEKPPPKSFSYPCYDLAEGKTVLVSLTEADWVGERRVMINQYMDWEWQRKEDHLLTHTISGDLYRFREVTPEEVVEQHSVIAKSFSKEEAIADERKRMDRAKQYEIITGVLSRQGGAAPRRGENKPVIICDVNRNQIVKCVIKWMDICDENGMSTKAVNAEHSSLLRYMVAGNLPFLNPPPLRFAYPCYALAEGNEVLVDLYEDGDLVIIDQSDKWRWEDKSKNLLEYYGDIYEFRETTEDCASARSSRMEAIKDEHRRVSEARKYNVIKGYLRRKDGPAPRMRG